jgi:glycoside/pentoside/hexuronide:cation symporter, GPH family
MVDATVGAPDALGGDREAATPKRPVGLGTKLAYGFGSVAFGVKDQGFNYFLLIFYSQVVGLDARLVGLAITVALIFEAVSDPIVGYWSDNFRSRWGRRHPFMYVAALPVAFSYFLLWDPPQGWSDGQLFWYLLVLAVLIRTFINFYETPSSALAPELTDDYDQRSSLLSFRSFFGWVGGNTMTVLMFLGIFPLFVTPAISNGQFNRDAYPVYGLIGSALMLTAILVSALGTHHRIPHLKPPPPQRKLSLLGVFREIFETLANRSFVALFLAAMFGAIATGLSAALAFFFYSYFWGFTTQQTGLLTSSVFVSAIIGATLAPIVTRRFGKKNAAMSIGLIAFLGSPVPMVLRLIGVLPDEPWVFWFVLLATMIDVGLIICFQVLAVSMLADLVEQAEVRTGRRSEGLFFSAYAFIRMAVQGMGVIVASFVLAAAGLPSGVNPAEAPPESIWRLGAYYVPVILSLWMAMLAVMSTYRIDRAAHEAALKTLADRARA